MNLRKIYHKIIPVKLSDNGYRLVSKEQAYILKELFR